MLKAGIVSLGCARNLVDSEVIIGSLKRCGYRISDIKDGLDLCVVNTCAFVESARKESVDTILELASLKKSGRIGKLIVCGCLPQLYKDKLSLQLPEADFFLGTADFHNISSILKSLGSKEKRSAITARPDYLYDDTTPRSSIGPAHSAYIKISEGCSNYCSYCIISKLRGGFRSRAVDSVLSEAGKLSRSGRLKEINLIGQDTTLFGMDRYGKPMLAHLLKRLSCLENDVRWIRVLYTHPAHYTDELIDTVRNEKKIVKYLDIPVQHINDRILKAMNRRTAKREIISLIAKLRKKMPGLTIRTSIIVGFPGETDREFRELMEFIKDTKFERLGAFTYSMEPGTRASRLRDQIPEEIKATRLDELMKAQQAISLKKNRELVGRRLTVLVDEKLEGEKDKYLARTSQDAPEVDCSVYLSGKGIKVGEFCRAKITDALEYDMMAEVL